ncbi:MAG TPA: hypothetical protein VLM40_00380, partial [Gemmata sp.]|nr:hypothetical protein [Gemmata sp.]
MPSSVPLGPQFQVSPTLGPPEVPPAVAIVDGAGDFIAVWQSYGTDGDGYGIYAQLFDANGAPIDLNGNTLNDDAFRVNTTTLGNQMAPAVASDGAGHFVIAWQGEVQNVATQTSNYDIFSEQGSYLGGALTQGGELQANTLHTTGNQLFPTVAMDASPDAKFVIAWQSETTDPVTGNDIYA